MADNVNHPPHYLARDIFVKCENGCTKHIECIDITRHFNFNLGNAIKYIWRADYKMKPIEDLHKAMWYLRDEIRKRHSEVSEPTEEEQFEIHATFTKENGQVEGCNHCMEGGVDQAHVLSCKLNPDNQGEEPLPTSVWQSPI